MWPFALVLKLTHESIFGDTFWIPWVTFFSHEILILYYFVPKFYEFSFCHTVTYTLMFYVVKVWVFSCLHLLSLGYSHGCQNHDLDRRITRFYDPASPKMSDPKPERVWSMRKTSQSTCRFFFLSFLTIQSTKLYQVLISRIIIIIQLNILSE